MQGIDPRDLLKDWIMGCSQCRAHLESNIGVILNEESEVLSDEDVEHVIIILNDFHRTFCVG